MLQRRLHRTQGCRVVRLCDRNTQGKQSPPALQGIHHLPSGSELSGLSGGIRTQIHVKPDSNYTWQLNIILPPLFCLINLYNVYEAYMKMHVLY